jgi:hypothetical protein
MRLKLGVLIFFLLTVLGMYGYGLSAYSSEEHKKCSVGVPEITEQCVQTKRQQDFPFRVGEWLMSLYSPLLP